MSEVDAFNLMGRAGRVTLNEYGNVFLFVGERGAKNYYNDVLLKPLPNQTLLPTKALKQSSKRYIVEILLKGRTNLLELGENYSDRGFTETTYEYAAKCLNMLLHDICNQKHYGEILRQKNERRRCFQRGNDERFRIFRAETHPDDRQAGMELPPAAREYRS